MAVKPKYSSIKGPIPVASRKFTDREEFIKVFRKSLRKNNSDGHNIIVYYGVGGIGKTSLRKELIKVLDEEYAEIIWGSLDFDLPAYREEETALYYLRQHFRKKYKIQFPSFELAYSVYWQKTHPQLNINKKNLPLLDEGGIVASLVSILGEIPLIGLIPNITKSVIKGHKYLSEWWRKRGQRELYNLPEHEAKDILERLPMFFASDLKDYLESKTKKCVLFLDTYEALWQNTHFEGSYFLRDEWIRELVSQLPEVLWVISGREKLRWDEKDEDWSKYIEQHLIGSLNYNDSKSFLNSCDITDRKIQDLIIESSKGVPYYLDLAVDTYFEIKTRYEREPDEKDFARTQSEVLDRLLKYLDRSEIETLKILSSSRLWNREIFQVLVNEFKTGYPVTAMQELCRFSFINRGLEEGTWMMHELMRNSLQNSIDEDMKKIIHKYLFDYYNNRLEELDVKNITIEQQNALKEAFYHGKIFLDSNRFYDWFINVSEMFQQAHQMSLMIPMFEEFVNYVERNFGSTHDHNIKCLNIIASLYEFLGKYKQAEIQFRRYLELTEKLYGCDSLDSVLASGKLGNLYRKVGSYSKAELHLKRAIATGRKFLGSEHPDLARLLNYLAELFDDMGQYEKEEPLLKEAIRIDKKILGKEHPDYAELIHNLALLYKSTAQYDKAEPLYKESMKIRKEVLGEKHTDYAETLNNLAALYDDMGQFEKAEPLYKEAMKINKEALGENHLYYASSLNNMAYLYSEMGQNEKACLLYYESMKVIREILGEKHPDYATLLSNLATFYDDTGQFEKAERLHLEALSIRKEILGEKHPNYALSLNNLAFLYSRMGRYEKAKPLYKESMKIYKEVLGERHPSYATSLNNLAGLYIEMRQYDKVEALYLEAMNIRKELLGERHPEYALSLNNLGALYSEMGLYEKAKTFCEKAVKIRREVLGLNHPDYALSLSNMASLYLKMRQYVKAKQLFQESMKIRKEIFGEKHPDYAYCLANLAILYGKQLKYEQSETLFKKAINIYENNLGTQHPGLSYAMQSMADLYFEQKRYAEAELNYCRALDIREKVLGEKHPLVIEALKSLRKTYEHTGQIDKSKEIEKRLIQLESKSAQSKTENKESSGI